MQKKAYQLVVDFIEIIEELNNRIDILETKLDINKKIDEESSEKHITKQ